jgi:hypothetical protein
MKNFLTSRQVAQLNQNKWNVNANGFYIDLYRDEFDEDVWSKYATKQTQITTLIS